MELNHRMQGHAMLHKLEQLPDTQGGVRTARVERVWCLLRAFDRFPMATAASLARGEVPQLNRVEWRFADTTRVDSACHQISWRVSLALHGKAHGPPSIEA